jgi:hypothetical protein
VVFEKYITAFSGVVEVKEYEFILYWNHAASPQNENIYFTPYAFHGVRRLGYMGKKIIV